MVEDWTTAVPAPIGHVSPSGTHSIPPTATRETLCPSVTVAVVVRNAAALLRHTLESIIAQTYSHMSIVVIDGASTDDTLSVAQEFSKHIDVLLSEPDAGVYDGMNKAARVAKTEYIIYMNAGDRFYTDQSLEEVLRFPGSPDIILGRYLYGHEGVSTIIKPMATSERLAHFEKGEMSSAIRDLACHQATITRLELLLSLGGYSLNYKLLSDQDLLLRAFDNHATFFHSDVVVCSYSSGGMSSNIKLSSEEFTRLLVSRNYSVDAVKAYFSVGPKRKVRALLKIIALRIPVFRGIYQQRNELASRVYELEQQSGTPAELDTKGLIALGVTSLGDFTAPIGHKDKIFSSHRSVWGLSDPVADVTTKLPKVHFVTFASGGAPFAYALKRISSEAADLGCFETIQVFNSQTAKARWPDYEHLEEFIKENKKGYGYWSWKPFVVAKRLAELPEGDILFYCDAGSELSRYGLPIFSQMVESASRSDHLFFRMHQYLETSWTKIEVLKYFEKELNFRVRNIGQVAATSFFIKNTATNRQLCDEWSYLSTHQEGALINDSMKHRQALGFVEHRYDQSLLSCLVQKYGLHNTVDTGLCNAFRAPRDWREDILMLELPIFWSHRKSDTHAASDINYRVELMRIRAYSFLASSRSGRGNPEVWETLRQRLILTYGELSPAHVLSTDAVKSMLNNAPLAD